MIQPESNAESMLAESRLLTPHSPVEKLTYNTLPQILPD